LKIDTNGVSCSRETHETTRDKHPTGLFSLYNKKLARYKHSSFFEVPSVTQKIFFLKIDTNGVSCSKERHETTRDKHPKGLFSLYNEKTCEVQTL
jgi:hypothetical protein